MKLLSQDQFLEALTAIGVQRGDDVMVHSALQYLGKPEGGVAMILQTLLEALGISDREPLPETGRGTLVVPTFNFAFARGEPFDRYHTPSSGMGTLSETARCHPKALRSTHPMQSIAVIGRYAEALTCLDTAGAFDHGSTFDKMLELDFKILLLGASVQAISLLHYVEQRVGVPYRYWKEFRGQVRMNDVWEERTYRMYVRDLDLNPQLDLRPIQRLLEERGRWFTQPLNYGYISLCLMRDFVQAAEDLLRRDPWVLVTNRP